MKYPVNWQDILCRFNIWHRYTDWQPDTHSHSNWGYGPVQMRFCFNCHWRVTRPVGDWPKRVVKLT